MPQIKTAQAAPSDTPDQAALEAAATAYTLPSGREILWLPPDEMEMLAFTGALPDPLTAAVYLALVDEGSISANEDDPASYHRMLNQRRGIDQIIRCGMVKPRYDPTLVVGDGVEVLGRRQLGQADRSFIWNWLFRLNATPAFIKAATEDRELDGAADVAPDRGDVPPDASAAAGDR